VHDRAPGPDGLIVKGGSRRAHAAWALAVVTLAGCPSGPEDKLVGWPPEEQIVPYGLPEVVAPVAPPEPDTSQPEAVTPEVTPPLRPCQALVEQLCQLWTPFADACREALTRVPDDTHPPTREACEALLTHYRQETHWGNPCGRYARAICTVSGEASERCKAAQSRTPVLTQRREWKACIADLLWFQARTLRR